MQDVVIEEQGDTSVTVIAAVPVAQGEQMLLHVEDGEGPGSTLVVQAVARRSIVAEGQLRHRLRLRIVRTGRGESA